jgi:hypothetical protein
MEITLNMSTSIGNKLEVIHRSLVGHPETVTGKLDTKLREPTQYKHA